MNTGNGDDFITFLQVFLKLFGFFGFLRLGANHEKVKYYHHTTKDNEVHGSGVGTTCLQKN
jgi:hypothetical protein